jgi:hypothetical protein
MDYSQVTVELREIAPGRTELTLTHAELPNEEERDSHGEGWLLTLEQLVLVL